VPTYIYFRLVNNYLPWSKFFLNNLRAINNVIMKQLHDEVASPKYHNARPIKGIWFFKILHTSMWVIIYTDWTSMLIVGCRLPIRQTYSIKYNSQTERIMGVIIYLSNIQCLGGSVFMLLNEVYHCLANNTNMAHLNFINYCFLRHLQYISKCQDGNIIQLLLLHGYWCVKWDVSRQLASSGNVLLIRMPIKTNYWSYQKNTQNSSYIWLTAQCVAPLA
jgi:hypothetical protein